MVHVATCFVLIPTQLKIYGRSSTTYKYKYNTSFQDITFKQMVVLGGYTVVQYLVLDFNTHEMFQLADIWCQRSILTRRK